MKRLVFLVPLALFAIAMGYFALGLGRDPAKLPSTLIGKALPAFDLPPVSDLSPGLADRDFQGRGNGDSGARLLNIWGSWCTACLVEHPFLMELARAGEIEIMGIDWKDAPGAGAAWLARHGNPFTRIGDDAEGRTAIDLGVTGAPETFIIDAQGRIRHKVVGPLGPATWQTEIAPLLQQLRAAAANEPAEGSADAR